VLLTVIERESDAVTRALVEANRGESRAAAAKVRAAVKSAKPRPSRRAAPQPIKRA
jgi:hypothetical protein